MMRKADTLVTTAQLTAWLCAHCTQLSLKFTMLWSHIQLHSVYMICLSFVVPQTSVKKHHLLFEQPYMYQPTRTFPLSPISPSRTRPVRTGWNNFVTVPRSELVPGPARYWRVGATTSVAHAPTTDVVGMRR